MDVGQVRIVGICQRRLIAALDYQDAGPRLGFEQVHQAGQRSLLGPPDAGSHQQHFRERVRVMNGQRLSAVIGGRGAVDIVQPLVNRGEREIQRGVVRR